MLFDILKFHGASFSPQFWLRVFDSVLLPIFDHVRAEVRGKGAGAGCGRRAGRATLVPPLVLCILLAPG